MTVCVCMCVRECCAVPACLSINLFLLSLPLSLPLSYPLYLCPSLPRFLSLSLSQFFAIGCRKKNYFPLMASQSECVGMSDVTVAPSACGKGGLSGGGWVKGDHLAG